MAKSANAHAHAHTGQYSGIALYPGANLLISFDLVVVCVCVRAIFFRRLLFHVREFTEFIWPINKNIMWK